MTDPAELAALFRCECGQLPWVYRTVRQAERVTQYLKCGCGRLSKRILPGWAVRRRQSKVATSLK